MLQLQLLHQEAVVVHLAVDGEKIKMKTNETGLCDVLEWQNGFANQ
jgi:hypothetical protein